MGPFTTIQEWVLESGLKGSMYIGYMFRVRRVVFKGVKTQYTHFIINNPYISRIVLGILPSSYYQVVSGSINAYKGKQII